MKVLVACEYSGIVRDAFIKAGHDAISADLLPTESPGPHYQGDVLNIINNGFDLMIAHPPCTYLAFSGEGYFNIDKYGKKAIQRIKKRSRAFDFFLKLYNADIPNICIENPKGYPMKFLKNYQIIQPWYFGDPQMKTTVLWLKNLPKLKHFDGPDLFNDKVTHTEKPEPIYVDKTTGKRRYFTDAISGASKTAAKNRSIFWPGIAAAMAEQWGNINTKI